MPLSPNPNAPFKVTCDQCHGKHFLGGLLCAKCRGDGFILVTPVSQLTTSQIVVRQMAWILLGVGIALSVIVGLLWWFRIL